MNGQSKNKEYANPESSASFMARRELPQYHKLIVAWMASVHVLAFTALFFFNWANFWAFMILYFTTACLGITLGYHRLLSHRTFKLPKFLERFFATCGVLAMQGSPLEWVAYHRIHHSKSDTNLDPHDSNRGFWYSHMIWFLKQYDEVIDSRIMSTLARDIRNDSYYRWLHKRSSQAFLQISLAAVLFAIGGVSMVLWGIFFRMAFVYHCTWFVNSVCHMWGYKNFHSDDKARNNYIVGILAWGEGWHNNHHRFQKMARTGLRPWEIDVTYYIIAAMEKLGLATNVNKTIPEPYKLGKIIRSAESRKAESQRRADSSDSFDPELTGAAAVNS